MASFPNRETSQVLRRSAYGMALAVPFLFTPAHSNSSQKIGGTLIRQLQAPYPHLAQSPETAGNDETSQPSAENPSNRPPDSLEQESLEPSVLITEVIIEGLSGHPDKKRLELAAYDAMIVRPGSTVTRSDLQRDLDAIYATGWFSAVRIEPVEGPLGVQLSVKVQPNPLLKEVVFEPKGNRLPKSVIQDTFKVDFGKTLNLNSLQARMKELQNWYVNKGYSLAKISGPNRVTSNGVIQLRVVEGAVEGVDVLFLNKEGEMTDEKGRKIRGKTKEWVIKREISIKPGETFNRNQLEKDIKRLYGTSLFSDIKVTLRPVAGQPGKVTILLGVIEQSTGSLSGGIGYSQAQGLFGQVGLQEGNLLGRSWNAAMNFTYGQYGGLADISFTDPWLKGDKHRTAFRTSLFLSRDVPQAFRSQEGGNIRGVSDYYDASSENAYQVDNNDHGKGKFDSVSAAKNSDDKSSWFDYTGNSVAIQRTGGSFVFSRPLNGGNPYKRVPWSVLAGVNIQKVRPISFSGESRPYGVATRDRKGGVVPNDDVICISFRCAKENQLLGFRTGATYNTLDDPRNPISGDFLSLGTQQFVSVGEDSPAFNRARVSYTHFIPVNVLKFHKGCRPKPGEEADCRQTIGMQVKAGTILGDLPPYEAFCTGGGNSVRGWHPCDLGVGRSFGEASVEYRFPIWSIVAGELFVDGATDFESQAKVPGRPGELLSKPGAGYSPGMGVIVTTPVGPLRLEAASQGLSGKWRFNLGVGWKF